jgi:hypothetical protein
VGIRFFTKMFKNGNTRTVENPGRMTQDLDAARGDYVKASETYFIPAPLHESVRPETVKRILTLDEAVDHMRENRPDVMTSDFEDDFLGKDRVVVPEQKSLTTVDPKRHWTIGVFYYVRTILVQLFSTLNV